MVCQWEPGTQYNYDSVVEYECHRYKIIQPHRSQADWAPPVTPALWGRLDDGHQHQGSGGFVDQSSGYHQQSAGGCGGQSDGASYGQQETGYGQQEKPQSGWLDEERKHQLKMGGGVLAGAALLGGGFLAYSKHKNKEEEEAKKQAWVNESSNEKWLQSAHATTQHYFSGGQSPPVHWVLLKRSDPIPNNAIEGGREGGHTLYIGRTYFKGGVHVGKVSHHLGGCVIGWGGKEHNDFENFEILCGDKHAVKWVNHSPSHGVIQAQGWQPIDGGREEDGRFLFVCQVQHEGGVHPCKAQDGTDFAIFSYGGKEKTSQEFNILTYA